MFYELVKINDKNLIRKEDINIICYCLIKTICLFYKKWFINID